MKSTQELGAVLKQAREAKKLAIGDLSERTGLPERYLHALETGDHTELPGKAYARIYFLNYARALELETDTLMLDWPHPEGDPTPPPTVELPNPWPKRIFFIVAAVVVLAVAYTMWQRSDSVTEPSPIPPSESAPPMLDSAALSDSTGDTATADTTQSPPAEAASGTTNITPPPKSEEPTRYALEVQARSQSWVVIEADGDTVEAALLAGGRTLKAEATDEFVLTAARPEVVRVLLDGKEVTLPSDRTRPLIRHRIDPQSPGGKP